MYLRCGALDIDFREIPCTVTSHIYQITRHATWRVHPPLSIISQTQGSYVHTTPFFSSFCAPSNFNREGFHNFQNFLPVQLLSSVSCIDCFVSPRNWFFLEYRAESFPLFQPCEVSRIGSLGCKFRKSQLAVIMCIVAQKAH